MTLRPPARVPSIFGREEERAMERVGPMGSPSPIPEYPEDPQWQYSSDAMDAHFSNLNRKVSDVEKKVDKLITQAGREWQSAVNVACDGSGNIAGFMVYEHKEGFVVDITQVVFWLDGQTPASVFNTANAFAVLYKNVVLATNIIAYSPQAGSTTVFPLTVNIPNDVPPVLRMNDRVLLQVGGGVGGLANKNVTVIMNGTIKREIA